MCGRCGSAATKCANAAAARARCTPCTRSSTSATCSACEPPPGSGAPDAYASGQEPPLTVAQEKYHVKNPLVAFLIRRFFRRIAGVLGAVAAESVLDAGCGEGELLRRGVLTGVATVSLDRSRQALAEIRTHTPGCRPVSGSVLELPFA